MRSAPRSIVTTWRQLENGGVIGDGFGGDHGFPSAAVVSKLEITEVSANAFCVSQTVSSWKKASTYTAPFAAV